MKAMPANFIDVLKNFIDIAYKIVIIFTINFVIQDRESKVVEVGADLVESSGFGESLDEADFPVFWMAAGAEGFELGQSGVGARNHGLPDIDPAWLMFTEAIQRLVDHP